MCEFTVYLDGHDDDNIVAERIIKATVKEEYILLMGSDGKSCRVPNARITKVDTIMTELLLATNTQ
ncbi:MAG: CooT family nickel-binding protein [Candidatus Methanomethylophilaceae archaeon]